MKFVLYCSPGKELQKQKRVINVENVLTCTMQPGTGRPHITNPLGLLMWKESEIVLLLQRNENVHQVQSHIHYPHTYIDMDADVCPAPELSWAFPEPGCCCPSKFLHPFLTFCLEPKALPMFYLLAEDLLALGVVDPCCPAPVSEALPVAIV